ncbi:hypothetical protein E2562_023322 [Oryza meyeriana var. granulata]|uniref:Uncharacterized protein n=1 Tax=Oryza meyeriana var. granulata TaxID=110450 RepID=A0A6G1E0C9_9ORYZ|nr:hypothetical protein E2562_023322 [Oryza meyeriana var. granulata]
MVLWLLLHTCRRSGWKRRHGKNINYPGLETVAFPAAAAGACHGGLYDRAVDYAARLKEMEKPVELAVF